MISKATRIRIARPTDNLREIVEMYTRGLGFDVIGQFEDHDGFDGMMVGHREHLYHLEFTHHRGTLVGGAPTQDNLLVFYIPDHREWEDACTAAEQAGFKRVTAYNPYWDVGGTTFEDLDGYRVVLQNREWQG